MITISEIRRELAIIEDEIMKNYTVEVGDDSNNLIECFEYIDTIVKDVGIELRMKK